LQQLNIEGSLESAIQSRSEFGEDADPGIAEVARERLAGLKD